MFNLISLQATDWLSQWPSLFGVAYLLAVAPRLSWIDWREHRLPNRLVLPGVGVALIGQITAVALHQASGMRLAQALVSAAAGFVLTLLANLRFGLGMGDVKLFTLIALTLGWFDPWLVALVWIVASFSAVGEILVRAVARRSMRLIGSIALGPHLLLGFLLAAAIPLVTIG